VVAAAILLIVGAIAALRDGGWSTVVLAAEPFVGGVGVAGAGLAWGGFLTLAIVNFIVMLLIIVATLILTIIAIAVVIGLLMGLAGG